MFAGIAHERIDSVYQISTGHSLVEEKLTILSAGVPFEYAIPFFYVLAVELCHINIERQPKDQVATERFDAFMMLLLIVRIPHCSLLRTPFT